MACTVACSALFVVIRVMNINERAPDRPGPRALDHSALTSMGTGKT
jgi:hypothetical protein